MENIEYGTKWEISGGNDKYFIEKRSSVRCCQLFCQFCNICIHNYTCTCPDFNIKNTICKHIHYICNISEKNPNSPLATSNIDSLHNVADDDITKCLGTLGKANVQRKNISEKFLSKFNLVASKVHNTNLKSIDESLLSQMLSQIQNLESLLNISLSSTSEQKSSFKEVASVSTNKNIVKQLTFHSTKNKKPIKNTQNTKPTVNEKKYINSLLSGSDKLLFISSSSVNDHNYTAPRN